MTTVLMRLKIENPTDKVNEKSIKPLLVVFRRMIKGFLEENLDKDQVVKMTRITEAKKNRMNKKRKCKICGNDFKTIMIERKLCTACIKVGRGIGVTPDGRTQNGTAVRTRRNPSTNNIEYFDTDRRRYVPL